MNRAKRIISLALALMMAASFCTTFGFAADPSLADFAIKLDDTTVTAVKSEGANAFTVKLPDGRPRVPQVSAEAGDTVTQAFLPDGAKEATATVKKKTGETVTITFQKDPSVGFVLQYDDYYTFDPDFEGATFTSSAPTVIEVNKSTGEMHVLAVSDQSVTITAKSGSQNKTLTVTKTIRAVLGIWMMTGQSNASLSYGTPTEAVMPKLGTALYFGWKLGAAPNYPTSLLPAVAGNVSNNDAPLSAALYDRTGEKVLMLNSAISGTGIGNFLPGNAPTDGIESTSKYTWFHTNNVYEKAHALWTAADFQKKYETRMRSYFFIQGEAEYGSDPTVHYNGFAVTTNSVAFTTLGKSYPKGTHTWRTYMTDVLGFDYCFDIMVSYRNVGMPTSTRTAQFRLAEAFDDYFIVSRLNQSFSYEEGTLRFDSLHYAQKGRNWLMDNAATRAAAIYQNAECLIPAERAVAYFEKIPYEDGDTIYVNAGDFYNYYTRADPFKSDDPFTYKFVGDNIVDFDSKNQSYLRIKKTAPAGSSCKMEIYSYASPDQPMTTVNIQVIGKASEKFTSRGTDVYSWTFRNNTPTTVSGDIDLVKSDLTTNSFMLTRDLTLDRTKYWSIEWRATDTVNGSMLLCSDASYKAGDSKPGFAYIYYTGNHWKIYHDTTHSHIWPDHNIVSGTHTYKLECADNIYTLSVDGEMIASQELIEGHGSYKADTTLVSKTTGGVGNFSDQWNLHYVLGGVNENANSSNYSYQGTVSSLTITIGNEEKRTITNINGYPYGAESGRGTKDDPYIINASVKAGTVLNDASFTAHTPAGSLYLSDEKFGGKTLNRVTCNRGTTVLYAMLRGTLADNSVFYKINATVSDTPDAFPSDLYPVDNVVIADAGEEATNADVGDVLKRTVNGKQYSFIKGYNLFDSAAEAVRELDANGTLLMMSGVYGDTVSVNQSLTVRGPKAGVDPNAKGAQESDSWTLSAGRADEAEEAVVTGTWTIGGDCTAFAVDGVTLTGAGGFKDGRTVDNRPMNVTLNNIIVHDVSKSDVLAFGESVRAQTHALTGKLTINNLRAYNINRRLMLTALENETLNNCYFSSGSGQIDSYRVPLVTDGKAHTASYTVTGCFFDNITISQFIQLYATANESPAIQSYKNVAYRLTGNVFKNCIGPSLSATNGAIQLYADFPNFTMNVTDNLIYEGAGSVSAANKAFLMGHGSNEKDVYTKDLAACYTIRKNRLISESAALPYLFSTITTDGHSHNNIDVSGNYFEVGGKDVDATVNGTSAATTNNHPISYADFRYTKADLSESTCSHPSNMRETVHTDATCTAKGKDQLICKNCDVVLETHWIDMTAHKPGSWEVVRQATTTAAGLRQKTCTVCGQVVASETIAKLSKPTVDSTKQFKDVVKGKWYVGAINFAVENNLFEGMDSTHFAPDGNMTRAMFVTVLGRLAGAKVNHKAATKFSDVPAGKWYTGYVKWASDNKIVEGDQGKFSPDDNVTREQICKMMVEYCSFAGIKLRSVNKATAFKDEASISKWAKTYVSKAQTAGFIEGDNGYFNPLDNATRAQVATIFMRFVQNYNAL